MIALYDGEIAWTDRHVGLLIERLEEHGLLDETIVVVTADHGEEFFEHGRFGHRKELYDESVRVPLVVRYPAELQQDLDRWLHEYNHDRKHQGKRCDGRTPYATLTEAKDLVRDKRISA